MSKIEYFEPEIISLQKHPDFNEKWLQDKIIENPKLLGLGELDVKDRERIQIGSGRLDILLQDPDTLRRYEVEIQLGKIDEAHIIRTIEYWDIERKRYPQYEHCAVIVAENITSRFLNVISLFNRTIPLIAIKLQAIKVESKIGLIFTTVLDETSLAQVPEEEEIEEPKDRAYWETKGSPATLKLTDKLLSMVQTFSPGYELKYNKDYIGLIKGAKVNNFVVFRPKKKHIRFEPRLPKQDDTTKRIEDAGLEMLAYDRHFQYYRIILSEEEIAKNKELILSLTGW